MRKSLLGAALICALAASSTASAQSHFLRGDTNGDSAINIGDAVATLSFLFSGGATPTCADAADVNDDGAINIADAVSLLSFLFSGGPAPAAPFPTWEADPTADSLTCKGTIVDLTGDIVSDMMLSNTNTYRLVSGTFVKAPATLTIQPGTTLLGDSATNGFLVIEAGAQINAAGTEVAPIVFTSDQPVGSRLRSDWGGVLLLGMGQNNNPGGVSPTEGITASWGGGATPDNDDSSGTMTYCRIEYGGTEISVDNEINALSMFGVGRGTTLHHIAVKQNFDDGFEWFGGAADLKFGIAIGIGDDDFDYSQGWIGRGQFWVTQKRDGGNDGFECDNNEFDFTALPLTLPTISNVTLIGTDTASRFGVVFRRGVGGIVFNAIVQNWGNAGVDIDDAATTAHSPANGELVLDYTTFFDNTENAETGDSEVALAYTSVDFVNTLNGNNAFPGASPTVDPYNLTSPDFRTAAGQILPFIPADPFFTDVNYVGAVAPTGTAWTASSWISYLNN
ncbi:MAG: dockerin type I repeat-containing protein [Planctomycetota bacterium]